MNNKLHPCIWFDGNAKEAAELYCTAFENTRITTNTPMVINFEIGGQKFMGLNGGPHFKPNASVSFFISCYTEAEIDKAWEKLTDEGKVLMPLNKYPWSEKYGWVQDKFGVSWQLIFGKPGDMDQKVVPAFMFTGNNAGKAEAAINYYVSVFKNSSVKMIARYEKGEPDVEGTIKHAQFRLDGQGFAAMDSSAAHGFNFTEGISVVVECNDQTGIDYLWNELTSNGGQESRCGWLKDKYGLSWQIIPANLGKIMSDPDKAGRVMQAIMTMNKLDIATLEKA